MAKAERAVTKLVAKAIHEFRMIEAGDRILVAVSGGKDSTALACDLAMRKTYFKPSFEILAVHIATDFCSCCKKPEMISLFEEWKLPFTEINVAVIGRLKEGQTMNCWWCSTQRRTELIKFAVREGYNKIALGHHLDDIIETMFMNMLFKGEFSTMPPVMPYKKYPVSIIRPLALVEERQIIDFADERGFRRAACTCPFGQESKRKDIRKKIAEFTGNSSNVKRRIFASMGNIKMDYLA